MRFSIAVLLVCAALTLLPVRGQNITGSIVGQVSDSSGSAVPGATFTVRNEGTGVTAEAIVDQSGSYSIPNLFAGVYSITVRKPGFETVDLRNIQLFASQTVRQDVTLRVGEARQTVEVTAAAPLIHTDTQTIGSTLVTRQLADLPLATRSSIASSNSHQASRPWVAIHEFPAAPIGAATITP